MSDFEKLNPFNGTYTNEVVEVKPTITDERRKFLQSVKVEDIHNDFFLAHETLLKEAEKIINAKENEEQLLYAKLYNMGFYRHKMASQGKVKEYQVNENKTIHDAIINYKRKYPLYKFITEYKVREICEKYNLLIGTPDIFIGEIPKKNLLEIVNFKIQKEDVIMGNFSMGYQIVKPITQADVEKAVLEHTTFTDEIKAHILECLGTKHLMYTIPDFDVKNVPISNLNFPQFKICATPNNFEMSNSRVEGLQIIDNDPIVLYPVLHGFLVISAWGDESKEVVNEINN